MHTMRKSLILVGLLLVGLLSPLFAAGNKEVPQVQLQTSGPQYFNPLSSGPNNHATLNFTVTLAVKSNKGYIPQYTLAIEDQSGKVVKDVTESEKSDVGWLGALFMGYKQFTLTRSVTWDGKDSSGQVVPDGDYKASLIVQDSSGHKQETKVGNFVVLTKPPVVSVSAPNGLIFNPTVTGKFSALQVEQTDGTTEPLWTGVFDDSAGQTVRTYTWKDSAPQSFAWDGKDDSGAAVPDGTYTYHVSSTDPAGNKSQDYTLSDIVLSTEKAPVSVSVNNPYFSPNGAKSTTTISLSTTASQPVVSWDLSVSNAGGATVRDYNGEGPFPTTITFDGKDASGTVLPNGAYAINFVSLFHNGATGVGSASAVLNTTPPQVGISLSNTLFAPTAESVKPTTTATLSETISQDVPVASWDVAVYDSTGTIVREVKAEGTPPAQLVYDGESDSGSVIPNGKYSAKYTVTTVDGLSAAASAQFAVDTTPPKVAVSVSAPLFTPTSSDSSNTEVISFTSNKPVTWTGSISDSQGQTLLSTTKAMTVDRVTLDKSNSQVMAAPDGVYNLSLTFTDDAGNLVKPTPVAITLLTRPVSIAIQVPGGFSPKGVDGNDTLVATITPDVPIPASKWDIAVVDSTGKTVADYPGTGALPAQFRWNGVVGQQGGQNVTAPDGTYTLRLTASYTLGLNSQAASNPFVLDQTPPQLSVSVKPGPFIETSEGLHGDADVTIRATDPTARIAHWRGELIDPSGATVKTLTGDGDPSQSGQWQGVVPGPAPTSIARVGYTLKLAVTDPYYNQATATVRVPVDVIGKLRADGKIQLLVPNVLFGPYRYGLASRSAEQGRENNSILRQVAGVMKDFPQYTLETDGYSMEIYKPTDRAYNSQENIIVPLSKNRADIVRNALVNLGVNPGRVVARFWGGMNPLVDPLNEAIRWQNRRVEFILLPPGAQAAAEPAELLARIH